MDRASRNQYCLVVVDDGVGMIDCNPEKFSGIGLLSIRQRAEWLGGALEIERVVPQGTRITLKLPAGEAPEVPDLATPRRSTG